jgi:glycosyltransferase involved in cell wall biosynthesis
MSGLRVLMTTDTVGGVWSYAMDLIGALAPYNVHVALATAGSPVSPSQREEVARLGNIELFESHHKLEWMSDPWEDVNATGEWLLRLEAVFRPDVIHLNGYAYGQKRFSAPVLTACHSCCLSWWSAVMRSPAPSYWERYRREVAAGLAGADVVVAPSRAIADAIASIYEPPAKPQVIYNGRPTQRAQASAKRNLILSAGRLWDEAKNIALLRHVAQDVDWPIEVAGNADHPDGRRECVDGLKLLGLLSPDDVARRMEEASIYALPAKYEPFGLSILEAAQAGCALVLGDIPSLREIWSDAAIYVDPTSAAQLRDALRLLIDRPDLRSAMAARSTARAKRYTPEKMAAAYFRHYHELTASRSPCRLVRSEPAA